MRRSTRAASPRAPAARASRPRTAARRPAARAGARQYQQTAQRQLRRFRQGSALAVALTAFLLLLWGEPVGVQEHAPAPAQQESSEVTAATSEDALPDPARAVSEATGTIRELLVSFYAFLPRLVLVLLVIGAAALLSRLPQLLIRRGLGTWERGAAASALTRLVVFLVATVAAVSVLAGDVRAIVGSVGLLGLAASWALQTPIESFTGWLLNSFRGYYRVGDRIAVGEVFGDVYRIDILTTTVWEAGGRGKPVAAAQPTGAMITFPNWELLRSNIVNYSHDFPYVWDELTLNVANESDLAYTAQVLEDTARRVLGSEVAQAATRYQEILQRERLSFEVEEVPRVYLSSNDSWTECTIRYVVPVRTRRRWSSDLVLAAAKEMARPEHKTRIVPVYPRTEVFLHDTRGRDAKIDGN